MVAVVVLLVAGALAVLQLRTGGDVVGRDAADTAAAVGASRSSTAGGDDLVDVPTAAPDPVEDRERVEAAGATRGQDPQARQERDAAIAERRAAQREAALRAQATAIERAARRASTGPFEVRIGSFNVLGSQHTAPGGMRAGRFAPASQRTPAAVELVQRHGIDVLGTQELQADQLRDFTARLGMAAYPGTAWGEAETDNSVLWDPDEFELVSGDRFYVTFVGRSRPQPIVRLRHRASGREFYVVNAHLSPGGGTRAGERYRGMDTLAAQIRSLRASGLPVLVTGDMNDREPFFCRVVAPAGISASNGGSTSSGCAPPPGPLPVDWVVGGGVAWSGYWRDTTPVDRRISDHFLISATASVS